MTGTDLMKIVGRNLKKYRTCANKTQEAFSDSIGINPSTYKNIERGARGLSFDMIATIADNLHISPFELFQEDGKEIILTHADDLLRNRPTSFIITVEKMIEALDQYDALTNTQNIGRSEEAT